MQTKTLTKAMQTKKANTAKPSNKPEAKPCKDCGRIVKPSQTGFGSFQRWIIGDYCEACRTEHKNKKQQRNQRQKGSSA